MNVFLEIRLHEELDVEDRRMLGRYSITHGRDSTKDSSGGAIGIAGRDLAVAECSLCE